MPNPRGIEKLSVTERPTKGSSHGPIDLFRQQEKQERKDRESFNKLIEEDNKTYLCHIGNITGEAKTNFKFHYNEIIGRSRTDPDNAARDMGVLADTVQFYALNERYSAFVKYLAENPLTNSTQENRETIELAERKRQQYCNDLDRAGEAYKLGRLPQHATQHRRITQAFAELWAQCEEEEKSLRTGSK